MGMNNVAQKGIDSQKTGHLRDEIQNIGQNPVTVKFINATFYENLELLHILNLHQ